MEARFGKRKSEKSLPELPKSESKFWEGADKHQTEIVKQSCKHNFEYKGREMVCRNCNIGYYADGRAYIEKGHIYVEDKLVI